MFQRGVEQQVVADQTGAAEGKQPRPRPDDLSPVGLLEQLSQGQQRYRGDEQAQQDQAGGLTSATAAPRTW